MPQPVSTDKEPSLAKQEITLKQIASTVLLVWFIL
jgi:hypothetical protein